MARELQRMRTLEEHHVQVAENCDTSSDYLDDDGRMKRTGTLLTASAHIITAVIGSGVLSLAWAMAQLGWVVGVATLLAFAFITWSCSTLLADCYRSPDSASGKRNYTYMDAVRSNLGGYKVQLCGLAQYVILVAVTIGYAITTSISMAAIKRSNCFHKKGHDIPCEESVNAYLIIFACMEILLSQIPNLHKVWWLSIVAAVMAFAYSFIGLGLALAKIAGGGRGRTTLTGAVVGVDVSESDKVWKSFQALGNIASAFSYSLVLIEIQDTLKSSRPENEVMKKASFIAVSTTTIFYLLCGICGYVAFGNNAPGNFLTGFGVYEPFWLINIGNICIVIHLIGAYQVFIQPVFQLVESWSHNRWPNQTFLSTKWVLKAPMLGNCSINLVRILWRTVYVILTTTIAMIFPFFNSFLGLIGAVAFWPLTVYFPIEMYLLQAKVQKFSIMWIWLRLMSLVCLLVSLAAATGSIQGLISELRSYKPFKL